MFDERLPKVLDWGLVALLVIALKHYYSVAEAHELQWLLYPVAVLLQNLSPLSFTELANGDWWDEQRQMSIVKACAGGNFFIASLLAYLWSLPHRRRPLRRLCTALAAAWLSTICANALRILISVYLGAALADGLALGMADTHRMIGILSYFSGLCLQLRLAKRDSVTTLPVAIACYWGVALCLPWLHALSGASNALNPTYVQWVAGIPLAFALLLYGAKRMAQARQW